MRTTLTAIALAATLGLATACDNRPDADEVATAALERNGIENVNVDFDDDANIVHLRGTVASEDIRTRAEETVRTAVGTTATVANEVLVEGPSEAMADEVDDVIEARLGVLKDGQPMLKERDVDFEVTSGVVTIKGDVKTAAEKAEVERLVRTVTGPKQVVNALEVDSE